MRFYVRLHSAAGGKLQRIVQVLAGPEETAAHLNALEHRIDNGQLESAVGQTDQHDRSGPFYGAERLLDSGWRGREYDGGVYSAVLLLERAPGALRRYGNFRA